MSIGAENDKPRAVLYLARQIIFLARRVKEDEMEEEMFARKGCRGSHPNIRMSGSLANR